MAVNPYRRSGTDASAAAWRKSSRSIADHACVEVNRTDRAVLIRDSKDPDGPRLRICGPAWAGFLAGIPPGPEYVG